MLASKKSCLRTSGDGGGGDDGDGGAPLKTFWQKHKNRTESTKEKTESRALALEWYIHAQLN